ncbi:MAG: alpha-1,2-mannosyltransferase [Kiritimatiellia bacterium]
MALLDQERLRVYPRILLVLYTLSVGGWWAAGTGLYDPAGKPIGGDFIAFFAAARMSLHGRAASVWSVAELHAEQVRILGPEVERLPYHYPPPGLLFMAPLGAAPYLVALGCWLVLGLALFGGACWLGVRDRADRGVWIMAALACPALLQNTIHGQTGALTAALMGAGLASVRTRPIVGGVVLGLLLFKPQYLPIVLLALLFGGRWRAVFGLVMGSTVCAALSLWLFGAESWRAFVENVPLVTKILMEGGVDLSKMPSAAAALLMLQVPPWVVQPVVMSLAVVCALVVAVAAWRRPPLRALVPVIVLATLLSTPFLFEYDLVVVTVGIGAWTLDGLERGWWRGERALLVLLYLTPVLTTPIAMATSLQLGPVILAVALGFALRRALVRGAAPLG